MSLCCQNEERRDAVRRMNGWNGLDYVEVSADQRSLHAYFLGKLPEELQQNRPELVDFLRVEGGERVTDIRITDVDPVIEDDPEKDDFLDIRLDKYGDFSTYTLHLIGVENVDPNYESVDFSFKVDCPQDLDCLAECKCDAEPLDEPEINYLARDYASFRQLILDRLALLVPDCDERHAPDTGIALVELLAYSADYLSYYQESVATEAYLATARQRISVRRHARLVDYFLHEGCNARAWVAVSVSQDLSLNPTDTFFITGMNDALVPKQTVLSEEDLVELPSRQYEVFEPLVADPLSPIKLYRAHNEIRFYTWGNTECCLELGSTSATLQDDWTTPSAPTPVDEPSDDDTTDDEPPRDDPPGDDQPDGDDLTSVVDEPDDDADDDDDHTEPDSPSPAAGDDVQAPVRALTSLAPGDVLIFEEVLGPVTGLAADADPTRRHAVRLTRVTPREDPVGAGNDAPPIPLVDIEWAEEDALPFTLCISAIGAAPTCTYLENITVARGNVVLTDHGARQDSEDLGEVPTRESEADCECAEQPGDVRLIPRKICPRLDKVPLTFAMPLPVDNPGAIVPAARLLQQDVRACAPQVWLMSEPAAPWQPRNDLLASGPDDKHYVVEIDNEGLANLRFGNGELGCRPPAKMHFRASYRVGNGASGNVGSEAISRLVLRDSSLSGASISVRNPLSAAGGTDAERIADAKLAAPHAFRQYLERAIIADDYARIAERNHDVQRAAAALAWTGSWYEADVAIDPLGQEHATPDLLEEITDDLERVRRMGHDLHLLPAEYVPIDLMLEVCVGANYQRAHVKAELLDVFSNRRLSGGRRGFFHVDELSFGEGVFLSQIVAAAQAVTGVVSVRVVRLQRLYEAPNREIANGVLPLAPNEIARLDNDPNYPEHGKLEIAVRGGR
jgi:hypothetical protein